MHRERLIFVGTSDLAGHFRGKAFPATDLAARAETGMGQPPTNIMLSAFGPIHATPFGTAGELALTPDITTLAQVEFSDSDTIAFCIGDLRQEGGAAWECCPRAFLRRALDALRDQAGLTIRAAFEQEFYCPDLETFGSFRLESARQAGPLAETLLGALRAAGVTPDSFVPEYAPGQFEATVAPSTGMRAADDAVITREIIRATARHLGTRATLAPLLAPDGVGSGTHIHISLADTNGEPALYDAVRPLQLSALGEHFVAGIARHLPALAALTAPAASSYYRMRPNKWAPALGNVALRDRGAAIRLCTALSGDAQARAKKYNVEYRVGDACASPYLALGAILHAGLAGITQGLTLADPVPLPTSLAEALAALAASAPARAWMGPILHDAYLMLKRAELAALADATEAEICTRYVNAY